MASTKINTVFHIKQQSPTGHLSILRNPARFKEARSTYFSPALGNASDTWVRFRAHQYLKERISIRKLSIVARIGKETEMFSQEQYEQANENILHRMDAVLKMESANPSWVLQAPIVSKTVKMVGEELESQLLGPRLDITEELEEMMQQEGRSLEEMEELEKAARDAQASAYWPAGYDSDDETVSDKSIDDYDEEQPRSGPSSNNSEALFANDQDDDDEDEDEHLYSFALPGNVSGADSHSHNSENNQQVEHTTLKPDQFDWADETDDMEEIKTTQPSSNRRLDDAENRFEDLVNHVYEALLDDLEDEYHRFKALQKPLSDKNPNWRGEECAWKVHPLAMTPKNMNPPQTGIPTIRLITPSGQLCALQEAFYSFDGPEWDEYFERRQIESAKLREELKTMEDFQDTCARLEAEEYWELVKLRDWERSVTQVRLGQKIATEQITNSQKDSVPEASIDNGETSTMDSNNETAHTKVDSEIEGPTTQIVDKDLESSKQLSAEDISPTESSLDFQLSVLPVLVSTSQAPLATTTDDFQTDNGEGKASSSKSLDGLEYEEDLFTQTRISEFDKSKALSELNEFRKLLATKVQKITRAHRQLKMEDEEIDRIAKMEAQQEFNRSEKLTNLRYAVVLLDLRARNEDGLIRQRDNESIFYITDKTKNNKSQGPSEIQFVGPLRNIIFENSWVLEKAPLYVQDSQQYWIEMSKDPLRELRETMKNLEHDEVHFRSNTEKYRQVFNFAKHHVDKEKNRICTSIKHIIQECALEAKYDSKIQKAKLAGDDERVKELTRRKELAQAASFENR
ncbi:hypothetical protein EG329_012012 [Mollisiaceae sp. DMI_Dod_QoI]|nr:hypothetical protein EG329_012012 [Helotiales sp. DMI_Dod_QoI]